MLDAIYKRAEVSEQCKCHLDDIVYAKTWYFLAHGRVADARKTLMKSAYANKITAPSSEAAFVYAWLLLEESNYAEAAPQMLLSETYEEKKNLLQRLGLAASPEPWYEHRLDVIFALARNRQWPEAKALIEHDYTISTYCFAGEAENVFDYGNDPWQKIRHARIASLKDEICKHATPLHQDAFAQESFQP